MIDMVHEISWRIGMLPKKLLKYSLYDQEHRGNVNMTKRDMQGMQGFCGEGEVQSRNSVPHRGGARQGWGTCCFTVTKGD